MSKILGFKKVDKTDWTKLGTLLPLFCSRACFFPLHCRPLLPFSSLSLTRSRGRRPSLLGTTRHLCRRPLLLLGHNRGTVQDWGKFCWAHYLLSFRHPVLYREWRWLFALFSLSKYVLVHQPHTGWAGLILWSRCKKGPGRRYSKISKHSSIGLQ